MKPFFIFIQWLIDVELAYLPFEGWPALAVGAFGYNFGKVELIATPLLLQNPGMGSIDRYRGLTRLKAIQWRKN